MLARFAKSIGVFLLVVAGVFFYWTEGIPSSDHLQHGAHRIEIDCSSGDVEVIGEQRNDVEVKGQDTAQRGPNVRVQDNGKMVRVQVRDIPQNAHIEIHVPSDSSVGVNMSAGRLQVRGINGDIATLLRSGQMIIEVPETGRFASATGSVLAGGINASPFQRHKGGLFRIFEWTGPGPNMLRAHVTTGELVVR